MTAAAPAPAGQDSAQTASCGPADMSRLAKDRQRKRRQRQRAKADGLTTFSALLPAAVVPELRALCQALRVYQHLEVSQVPLRDPASGRLVPLRSRR